MKHKEFGMASELSEDLLEVCRWIRERGKVVLGWLKTDPRPLPVSPSLEKSWTEVSGGYTLLKNLC